MNQRSPQELLQEYALTRSEAAFTELVRIHLGLVYGTAFRILRSRDLAEDVCQQVFVTLAKEAGKLAARPSVRSWLHKTTHNFAVMTIRSEERRKARETAASSLLSPEPDSDSAWTALAPHIDAAMAQLKESDRELVLLKYFEEKSGTEIATLLNLNDTAVHKRTSRALERLRNLLKKQGTLLSAATLGTLLSTKAAVPILPSDPSILVSQIAEKVSTISIVAETAFTPAWILAQIQGKPIATAALVVLCATLGTTGFLAGRTAAVKHHTAIAWQAVVGGDKSTAQLSPAPTTEPLTAPPTVSVSEILSEAAYFFRLNHSDPDAWAKGTIRLQQLRPEQAQEALAALNLYRGESSVFVPMAAAILGILAQTEPETAINYALENIKESSRATSFENIFRAWSAHDPTSAWQYFVETAQTQKLPFSYSSWQWMPKAIFSEWAFHDPEGAFQEYARLDYAEEQLAMWGLVAASLDPRDREPILRQVSSLADEQKRRRLCVKIASAWARNAPEAAAQWGSTLSFQNPAARVNILAEVAEEWWRIDPHATVKWLLGQAPVEVRDYLMPILASQEGGPL